MMTELGEEIANPGSKKVADYRVTLQKSRQRLEQKIRCGTKKAEFESYASCLRAIQHALGFIDSKQR